MPEFANLLRSFLFLRENTHTVKSEGSRPFDYM